MAVEKSKVHVSKISSIVFSLADLPVGPVQTDSLSELVRSVTTMGDVQPVRFGNGEETYMLALKDLWVVLGKGLGGVAWVLAQQS